jgi:23S rRNA (cytidine1920-2'-O)/16S rRNA (cytidine1409-2'-O)-methyltransferase
VTADPTNPAAPKPYVSKGGLKLAHALEAFALSPAGLVCADLGCSTGGFTDCLLRHGAAKVYAVDTAYGELAWTLRKDPRVVVMERENALHATPREPVSLVTLDVSWTPTKLAVPAAMRWLGADGRIIALVKPHYEAKGLGVTLPRGGVLADTDAERIARTVIDALPAASVEVLAETRSPIRGGTKQTGNHEWLVLIRPR